MSLTRDQEISVAKIKETYAYFSDSVVAGTRPVNVLGSLLVLSQANKETKYFDSDLMQRACVIDATSAGTAVIEIELGKAYANHRGKRRFLS